MEPTKFSVSRMSDQHIFRSLEEAFGESWNNTAFRGTTIFGEKVDGKCVQGSHLDALLQAGTIVIRTFIFTVHEFVTVQVERKWDGDGKRLLGYLDEVTVTPCVAGGEGQEVTRGKVVVGANLVKALRQSLHAVDDKDFIEYLREEDRAHYLAREASLQKLQEMQEKSFDRLNDFTVEQMQRYEDRQRQLQEKYLDKERDMEGRYAAKEKELEQKEEVLRQKIKELDDRANTHVRREIRKDLKQTLVARSKEFELTEGAKNRRWWVLGGYVVLLVILGSLGGYFLFSTPKQEGGLEVLWIVRQIVLGAAFATTAGFCLRWMSQWAKAHADEEFRLKRLELDIDRASWVVEHALEWKAEKGTDIPEYLLERLSRNLFAEDSKQESSMTAADALASAILRSSENVKFNMGNSAIELNHKGVSQLDKSPGA